MTAYKKPPSGLIQNLLGLAVLSIISHAAVAAESSLTLPLEDHSTSQLEIPIAKEHRQSVFAGTLRFEGDKYASEVDNNPKLNQSILVGANLNLDDRSSHWHNKMDITGEKYLDWGVSNYSVQELYTSYLWNNDRSQIAVGRKLEFWSQVDQDWQLGLWQPLATYDALRLQDQGLTGVFYKQKFDDFELLGFGSPIFIPTMGPEVQEKNGDLVYDNRWNRSPSSTFMLYQTATRIVYSLDSYDVGHLIQNPGAGMRLRMGGDREGLWTSANYGYKPINSITLQYEKSLDINSQTGDVTVGPNVAYHQIFGGDLGYKYSRGMVALSYLQDLPDPKKPTDDWVLQNPHGLQAYGVHADQSYDVVGFLNPVTVTLGYLKVIGGDFTDYDSSGTPQGAIFNQRMNFTNSALVRMDFVSFIAAKKLTTTVKFQRDFDQQGSLFHAELNYFPTKSVALLLGGDVLGVDNDSVNNTDSGFLNQYRANDRIYGGMSYVF
jgi:hypothetical protein